MFPVLATVLLLGAIIAGLIFWSFGNDDGLHPFRIVVSPPNAEVTIDGSRVELLDGQIDLARDVTTSITITASAGLDYEVHSQRIDVNEYSIEQPFTVKLGTSARNIAAQATRLYKKNDVDQAVALMGQAIKKDGRFAIFPKPTHVSDPTELGLISKFTITSDGAWIVAGYRNGTVARWKTALVENGPQTPQLFYRHAGVVENIDSSGPWVATTDSQHQVTIANLDDGSPPASFSLDTFGEIKIAVAPNGNSVFTGSDNKIHHWVRNENQFNRTELGAHQDKISTILLTGDQKVLTGSWDGSVSNWQIDEPPVMQSIGQLAENGEVYATSVSSSHIAFGGDAPGGSARVALTSKDGNTPIALSEGPRSPINVLSFNQAGDLLAAGSEDDGQVTVWRQHSAKLWRRIALPSQHSDSITALAFHDSKYLVSSGSDGLVIIWHLANDQIRATVLGSQLTPLNDLRISANGRHVVALTIEGKLLHWNLPQCLLIEQACEAIGETPKDPYQVPLDGGVEA